ncbi:MAG: hypothetical protein WC814_03340 [Candidatus Paceibacterota bacterium]|jgi:hypothetical protein
MSWAARRRFFILLILGTIVVAFLAIVSIATFSNTPSCTDGLQNQDETGIDCGGSCAYLCTASVQPPTVLFTKALSNGAGRTDIIAAVENKNAGAAANDVPYRLTLFGEGQALIQEVTGTLDLPPGAIVPIYVPGIVSGKQTVTRAFLSIAASAPKWFTFPANARTVPLVSNTTQSGSTDAPRIEAVLTNSTVTPLFNVRAVILVHDKNGDVIAASETVIPLIPAQGQATATFTWNSAFTDTPATIEVVPIIPLPDR